MSVARVYPSNVQAEADLLGCLLVKPSLMDTDDNQFRSEWFYDPFHVSVAAAIIRLVDRGIKVHPAALLEEMKKTGPIDEKETATRIVDLRSSMVSTAMYDSYLGKVVDTYQRREIMTATKDGFNRAENGDDITSISDDLVNSVAGLHRMAKAKTFVSLDTHLDAVLEEINLRASDAFVPDEYIKSRFPDLDNLICGFPVGEMTIIAARPGVGKTAFAINLTTRIAPHHRVGFFSLEMTAKQLTKRIMGDLAHLPAYLYRSGKMSDAEWRLTLNGINKISNERVWIDDTPGLKVNELRNRARRLVAKQKVSVIIIDYLQYIHGSVKTDSKNFETEEISRTLKEMAKELNIALIVLSQLSRASEKGNRKPGLADLRNSGAIEQDAALAVFIHREGGGTEAEFLVRKARFGACGDVPMIWLPEIVKFVDAGGMR